MRSLWALSAGASARSMLSTTVCGPSRSKSWMPIETMRRKSRKTIRRSIGRSIWLAMSLVFLVEGDVARPTGQVLAGIDDEYIAGEGRRRHDEAQRTH